jgi:hypothetical protein
LIGRAQPAREQTEGALELGVLVGLDDSTPKGELLKVVEELDRCLLVVSRVDPQDPDPGAVVDCRVLIVLLAGPADRLE